jgi:hypothetical protein
VSKPNRNIVASVLGGFALSLVAGGALAGSWKDGIKTVNIGVILQSIYGEGWRENDRAA